MITKMKKHREIRGKIKIDFNTIRFSKSMKTEGMPHYIHFENDNYIIQCFISNSRQINKEITILNIIDCNKGMSMPLSRFYNTKREIEIELENKYPELVL